VCRPTRPRTWQVLRAQEDLRVYAELQNKQCAVYGDDEAAREAAGKATHPRGISQPREAGGCLRATPQHADRC